mgnify:CR=1 FL=1
MYSLEFKKQAIKDLKKLPKPVQEEILKKLIPPAYMKAIQEHNLKPIMNPKLHVEKIGEGEDWLFHAFTCELPVV